MTDLVVRKMTFQFDATVPFMWQPANPHFAIFCNAFTIPFDDRGASAEQVMASALRNELTYRIHRRSGPRPVFHAVPTVQLPSRCCGVWPCRKRRITIRPTSRCPIGPTAGCASTTVGPT